MVFVYIISNSWIVPQNSRNNLVLPWASQKTVLRVALKFPSVIQNVGSLSLRESRYEQVLTFIRTKSYASLVCTAQANNVLHLFEQVDFSFPLRFNYSCLWSKEAGHGHVWSGRYSNAEGVKAKAPYGQQPGMDGGNNYRIWSEEWIEYIRKAKCEGKWKLVHRVLGRTNRCDRGETILLMAGGETRACPAETGRKPWKHKGSYHFSSSLREEYLPDIFRVHGAFNFMLVVTSVYWRWKRC